MSCIDMEMGRVFKVLTTSPAALPTPHPVRDCIICIVYVCLIMHGRPASNGTWPQVTHAELQQTYRELSWPHRSILHSLRAIT